MDSRSAQDGRHIRFQLCYVVFGYGSGFLFGFKFTFSSLLWFADFVWVQIVFSKGDVLQRSLQQCSCYTCIAQSVLFEDWKFGSCTRLQRRVQGFIDHLVPSIEATIMTQLEHSMLHVFMAENLYGLPSHHFHTRRYMMSLPPAKRFLVVCNELPELMV